MDKESSSFIITCPKCGKKGKIVQQKGFLRQVCTGIATIVKEDADISKYKYDTADYADIKISFGPTVVRITCKCGYSNVIKVLS